MFLAFGKAMPHKHNKDADGGRDSPMSGHFTAVKPLVGCVGWIVLQRGCHAWKNLIVWF